MMIPGYCTECRRVRTVRVNGHRLAMAHALGGVAQGVCSECERAEEDKRAAEYRRQRGVE